MSYCLNPVCPNPENLADTELCQACGAKLLLRDRYRVLYALGQGGFGATFLAKDEGLPGQPQCVIKQLRPTASAPHVLQMARDLFEREAQTLGRIGNHPQIPRLLDYFEANEEFYLVQEYVSGSTLQQEVKRSGAFSEAGVKQFLSEILPILQYIHSHQVIHRDIKPANLIRRSHDCKLVLIDFGAVKNQVNSSAASLSDQTALTAYAIGTPGFAPPEQMAMRPVYASDLYALGVTCIYLLTGKSPKDLDYDAATGELLWQRQVHISDHFAGVLKKMLEVSVRHRFQSANEILRSLDLEPYLESLANSMTVTNKPPETKKTDTPETTSPAARAAMAIRARNQRSETTNVQAPYQARMIVPRPGNLSNNASNNASNTGGLNGGLNSRGSNGRIQNSNGQNQPPAKMDAVGLQSYYNKGKRDFASCDLSTLNLAKFNLSGAVFHQANLSRVNLQGADLSNTDFGRANLNRAILRDANLVRSYLSNADLEGADLRGADLSHAYLLNANLRGTNLCGANLTGAKLSEDQLAVARTNWMTVRPSGKRGIW